MTSPTFPKQVLVLFEEPEPGDFTMLVEEHVDGISDGKHVGVYKLERVMMMQSKSELVPLPPKAKKKTKKTPRRRK